MWFEEYVLRQKKIIRRNVERNIEENSGESVECTENTERAEFNIKAFNDNMEEPRITHRANAQTDKLFAELDSFPGLNRSERIIFG